VVVGVSKVEHSMVAHKEAYQGGYALHNPLRIWGMWCPG